ncbi:uncharacterized protein LOC115882462 isoform X2 [Sitophilus oryzae]|uniref:Uncharacterized protein LOC115882462 isoform X2 n=1 Tax=Sitophilus oryzae TaxID=7048 RepID=A0A6J2XZB0_SITOR|nr:uncharacterized protein LOC115882462 isoform X2 [Sitophilus oryzae]
MSKACIVCGSKYKKDTILSFHRFPKGPEIRKKWLDAIGIEDINVGPTTFVCSKHFRIVDFADNMYHWPKKMLLPHAFPQPSACYKIQKKNLGSLEKSESIEDTFKQSSGSDVESYESPSSTSTDPLVKEEYDLTIEEPTISEDIMPTVITICTEPCTSNGTYTNSFMQRDYKRDFKATPEHWKLVVEYLEKYPILLKSKFEKYFDGDRADEEVIWNELVNKLNSLGMGTRSGEKWQQTIGRWKSKIKAKAAALWLEMERSGDNPVQSPPLTDTEEKLLNLLDWKSVTEESVNMELRPAEERDFKTTPEHWKLVVQYLEQYPILLKSKFEKNFDRNRADQKAIWNKLVDHLNSLGMGTRSGEKWQQAIGRWKSKIKAKAAAFWLEVKRSGDNLVQSPPLTDTEEKLLRLLGWKSMTDNENTELRINIGANALATPASFKLEEPRQSYLGKGKRINLSARDEVPLKKKRKIISRKARRLVYQNRMHGQLMKKLSGIDKNLAVMAAAITDISNSIKRVVDHVTKNGNN